MTREFWVCEGRETDFERVYGSTGLWVELLRKSEGYLETELRCDSGVERRYRTFDFWRSHLDFEVFRELFQTDYERLSRLIEIEGLLEKELLLGSFYIDEPDSDEDTGLVPA